MLNIDLESPEYRALHSVVEYSAEYRPGGPNYSEFEYSAEYRHEGPNTELYIQMLNIVLNIDLEGRI